MLSENIDDVFEIGALWGAELSFITCYNNRLIDIWWNVVGENGADNMVKIHRLKLIYMIVLIINW